MLSPRFAAHIWTTLILFAPTLACGAPPKPVQQLAHVASKKAGDVVDYVDDWVNAEPMQQRHDKCAEEGGTWVKHVHVSPCVDGKVTVDFDGRIEAQACDAGEGGEEQFQCVHQSADGQSYFNDGPSVPNVLQRLSSSVSGDVDQLRYLDLFWPAGVNHDYCYHHGASAYGLTQADCDAQYFSDLSAVCANDAFRDQYDWYKQRSCRQVAATHYAAVRGQGERAYHMMQSYVRYPAWEPMWRAFGLPEDAVDQELADEIEDKLRWVGMLPEEEASDAHGG